MADIPKAEEIAGLVSLLAYGFLLRRAYHTKVQQRTEDAGQTLLWAAIFSAPLKLLYDWVAWPPLLVFRVPSRFHYPLAFAGNLAWSALIGLLAGVLSINWIRWRRDKPYSESKNKVLMFLGNSKPIKFFARRPPRLDLAQEWIQERAANQQWVVVELKDGRGILGWIRFYDLSQERAKDMHIVLERPFFVDVATGKTGASMGSEMLVASSEIKSIRIVP